MNQCIRIEAGHEKVQSENKKNVNKSVYNVL